MNKEQERLLNQAADAKLIHINDVVIFPLLQKKIDEQVSALCETFKVDGEVKMAHVAYIAACRDLVQELKSRARHGDKAAEKLGYHKLD